MESIVKASEKGKIKIKQVIDNTAKDVAIVIHLQPGQSTDIVMDALYAFTDCEISLSPNACVIFEDKPRFMKVNDILKANTNQTVDLLKKELEIKKADLWRGSCSRHWRRYSSKKDLIGTLKSARLLKR